MEHLLGFDIGGTKTEVALFSLGGQKSQFQVSRNGSLSNISVVSSKRMPTNRDLGYQAYLENILPLVNELLSENSIKVEELIGMGLGLPGSVHPETGEMLNGNTRMMVGKDVASDFKNIFNYKGQVAVNNDASCFALAEALCGAGIKYEKEHGVPVAKQQSIGIILGTGCGGGLINAGKIINGGKGGGGEIGHSTLITEGIPCYCGRKGCAEQYLAGPALEAAMGSGKAFEVFEMALQGNSKASSVVENYKQYLADFLINLNNVYDPHFFVLGGGVSKQDPIYEGIEETLGKKMFVKGKIPNVYKHQLSDSAGVLGAAIMVL